MLNEPILIDTKYIVTAYSNDNVTKLADTKNFKLMRNGFEFEIEWKNIQYITDGKTFTPKNYSDGNIVWLSTDPIPLKKTNTIISQFKQIDGKWYVLGGK